MPRDPWGNPYVYEPSGADWADVLSYGADGQPGGKGAGADISGRFGRLGSTPARLPALARRRRVHRPADRRGARRRSAALVRGPPSPA